MNTYKIEMKFIDNSETFVMAVLACIYEELKLRVKSRKGDNKWIGSVRMAMDDVVRCYKMIFLYQHNPAEQFNHFDMLELVENATFLIKLQPKMDNLIKILGGDQITIEIANRFPLYMNQVLPDFRNFIIFKEV